MRRCEDWPERLHLFIATARTRPLAYGVWDCCLFPADVIAAMTGEDLAARWRGSYHDEPSARALLESLGGVEEIARAFLGEALTSVKLAQRGDFAIWNGHRGHCGGIVIGRETMVLAEQGGLIAVPTRACYKAWRV